MSPAFDPGLSVDERIVFARKAEENGDIDQALAILKIALEAANDHKVLNLIASVCWRAGRLEEALTWCERIVSLLPGDVLARNASGLCLLALGRVEEAISAFEKAIDLSPNTALLYHNLGLALQRQNRLPEAVAAFRKATELNPNLFESLSSLGHLLMIQGSSEGIAVLKRAYEVAPETAAGHLEMARALFVGENSLEEAERHVRATLAIEPENPPAHTLLAMILQQRGLFQEASTRLKHSIELKPTEVGPYWELFYGSKVTEADLPLVVAAQSMVMDPERTDHDRRVLSFALGKAYNDLERYEEAMIAYHQANRLSKILEGKAFERAVYERQVDGTIEKFTADFFSGDSGSGSRSELPIFIVGMFRSGTTLVEHILSSHPRVRAAGELPFWPDRAAKALGSPSAARELAASYLELLAGYADPETERVTDKHPLNYANLGLLHSLYPNARFIFCLRHPVDTLLSLYFTYFRSSPVYGCDPGNLVFGYRQHLRLLEHWREVIPRDRLLEVRYEEVVAHPEAQIRRLIDFCGLAWDERCLHPEQNAREVRTASRWQVRQPIYRTSVARWSNYEPYLGEFGELLER